MKIIRSKDFTASRAWGALDIAKMNGITTRLHWTNQPYRWHVNEGEEIFAVLNGSVEMRYKENGEEISTVLQAGDIFYASVGTEHVAHPIGEARILVVEREGSLEPLPRDAADRHLRQLDSPSSDEVDCCAEVATPSAPKQCPW